jgi:uncharacterized protein (TIGR00299 family) protein
MLAYFDCFSGISGDMALGALIDAGAPLDALREQLGRLGLAGYRLEVEEYRDHGLRGAQARVVLEAADQPRRRLSDILALLDASRLDRAVVEHAAAVFRRLARAEAAVHGVEVEAVHFHEVGAVDAIVDVVGTVAALRLLGVDRVYASALPLGGGTVQTEHGPLPLPAPGTLALLAEAGAPTRPLEAGRELVTPTGAALLAELATFEQPPMAVQKVGYGFGRLRLPWPNCLRVWLAEARPGPGGRDQVVLLEANLDDSTPELLGYGMERLFAAGALDVYFQPLQMKKNRPGVLLGVIARPEDAERLAALILAETTTLGVRSARLERQIAARRESVVETPFGPVKVKVKQVAAQTVVAPEYEDAARVAREQGVPLAEVYRAVQRAELPER